MLLYFRKVQHPHPSFLGVVTVPEGIAILSPLVKGHNLHDHLFASERKVRQEYSSCALKLHISSFLFLRSSVCTQVCQAIIYLHVCDPPLCHLDIKPANILVKSMLAITLAKPNRTH